MNGIGFRFLQVFQVDTLESFPTVGCLSPHAFPPSYCLRQSQWWRFFISISRSSSWTVIYMSRALMLPLIISPSLLAVSSRGGTSSSLMLSHQKWYVVLVRRKGGLKRGLAVLSELHFWWLNMQSDKVEAIINMLRLLNYRVMDSM